ncbi:MAG: hypothetical protein IJT32_08135 [Lachnospiraceae bacterium]|nr:hypothetical protein [Lachnospiraceae bacterium]
MRKVELKYIETLVHDARLGDSNAFASLFAMTYQQQFSLAYSYVWNTGYAQDILFDIYLHALHSIKRLARAKQFNRWMNEMNIAASEEMAEEKDIHPPKGRLHIPVFEVEDAKRLLEFIFFEEGQKENSIPLETLIEYNMYRQRRYGLQKFVAIGIIAAVVATPVLFLKPAMTVEPNHDVFLRGRIRYDVTIDSSVPVDTVTATVGGTQTPVYQSGRNTFYILPTKNGTLSVTAKFYNFQTTTAEATVTDVDRSVPVLKDNFVKEGKVILYVDDEGSSVDYQKIFALDAGNNRVDPISTMAIIGEVIFPYPDTFLNVYIPDRAGNVLHLVINNNSTEKEAES